MRLNEVSREQLPAAAQAVWDQIAGTRGRVGGPYQVLMHAPALAAKVEELGRYLRFGATLPGADRELAILAAARAMGAQYEWVAHEPVARREGARPEAIEAVRAAGSVGGLTPRELVVVDVAQAIARTRGLAPDLYAAAIAQLGEEHLVELVTLAGYYGMIAALLLAFQVPLPEGVVAPF